MGSEDFDGLSAEEVYEQSPDFDDRSDRVNWYFEEGPEVVSYGVEGAEDVSLKLSEVIDESEYNFEELLEFMDDSGMVGDVSEYSDEELEVLGLYCYQYYSSDPSYIFDGRGETYVSSIDADVDMDMAELIEFINSETPLETTSCCSGTIRDHFDVSQFVDGIDPIDISELSSVYSPSICFDPMYHSVEDGSVVVDEEFYELQELLTDDMDTPYLENFRFKYHHDVGLYVLELPELYVHDLMEEFDSIAGYDGFLVWVFGELEKEFADFFDVE